MVTTINDNPFTVVEIKDTLPEDNAEDQLSYLTFFSRIEGLCPFTEKQKTIFIQGQKTARVARLWLSRGLWGTTLLSVLPVVAFPFVTYVPPVAKWSQESPIHTLYLTLGLTAVAAAVNWINFVATGTLPDRSATANINREYQFKKTLNIYKKIGCCLISHPELATQLDIPKIQKAMEELIPTEIAEDHLSYLKKALNQLNNP